MFKEALRSSIAVGHVAWEWSLSSLGYPWSVLSVHTPIYWLCVDALAGLKLGRELRNWPHRGTCELM